MTTRKPEDLAAHPVIQAIHKDLAEGKSRMDKIEADLAVNTRLTEEMHDWLRVGKSGLQVLGWMGHFLGWAVSLMAGAAALYGAYTKWLTK